jgi:Aspartyl-tRNA synthetase
MSKAEESTEIHILENGIKVDKLFSTLCTSMKDLGCGQVNENLIGRVVKLAGWVESVRDHGGLKFIDLVDITGEVQIVVRPETVNADALKDLDNIGNFYVLNIEGEVRRRPEGTENPNISTGKVEVLARSVKVLSKSDVPPFWPNERKQISEEVRLKYRYIDMRRPQMRKNIIFRHLVARKIREFMWSKKLH